MTRVWCVESVDQINEFGLRQVQVGHLQRMQDTQLTS